MKPRRPVGERGSAALELVLLAPVLLALIGLAILGGRIQVAGGSVEQAAADAARQASLARDATTASSAATDAALGSLQRQQLECTDVDVTVDTAGFAVPVGQPAQVTAHVSCTVRLSDLGVPGAPVAKTLDAEAVSVLDTYRGRQP